MDLNHNILSTSTKPWAVQASGQPFVYFNYNPVGDNIKVYSSQTDDWERNYTYDRLGRRLTYQEGELVESLTYDGSNLASHTQNWMENGSPHTKTTHYHYNAHRLDSVSYEDALTTIYHYDQYGRVDSLYDESGVMCYEYGNMGEVTRETRIYALPFLTSALALSTQFGYDSWGRVDSIVYPDNETVKYRYGCGGQLQGICSRQVPAYTYLDSVLYDRFGAKVSQKYGNGLKTTYSYNSLTRRLSNIATMDGGSQVSSFAYTYDNVGNVTQVASTCPWLNSQTFSETFTYDASDQLTSATETQNQSYRLDVGYGDWGRITDYALTRTDMQDNSSTSDAYSFTYPANPSGVQGAQTMLAPESQTGTTDAQFTFGINGSLRKREVTSPDNYTEYYLFNSQANLKAYSDDGLDFAYYGYNASNTRTYKLSMLNMGQWVNGQPQPLNLQLQNVMFYPNAYLNFNHNGEYTKHYYNGSERIASRLGDNTQTMDVVSNDRLGFRIMQADQQARAELLEVVEAGDVPIETPSVDVSALQTTGSTTDVFYYHTNHLGSTAFVTDQSQTVTQGFLYAPFGEITTEYNATFGNDIIPKYSFNAKELDEETGMYYYEARYYKPPVFTSRDPLMSEKPWLTPYHYCSNNPVGRVDPSGMFDDWVEKTDGTIYWDENATSQETTKSGERYLGKMGYDLNTVYFPDGTTRERVYTLKQYNVTDKATEHERAMQYKHELGIHEGGFSIHPEGIVNAMQNVNGFLMKNEDFINCSSNIGTILANIAENDKLNNSFSAFNFVSASMHVPNYIKTIKDGSWNKSNWLSVATDISSICGFYGSIINSYLISIKYVAKKETELEFKLRDMFSPKSIYNKYYQ